MSNPVGLRVTQPQGRPAGPMTQLTFAGAWMAILAFCALTWGAALLLFL